MNILLLSMSSFPKGEKIIDADGNEVRKLQKSKFTYDNSNGQKIEREYYSQLEPITRMLIEEGRQPDEVIMLCTDESIGKKYIACDDEQVLLISPCEFYERRINELVEPGKKIVYTKIPQSLNKGVIDPDLPESKRDAVAEVASYLLQKKKENDDLHVWIDTQGGMRDISLLMNAVVSLLKTSAISIEDIYSINFTDGIGKVMKQNDTYRIFEFVSGMNEFIEYGRTDQLIKYYKNIEQKKLPEIINVMQSLSNAIMVCDTEAFDDELKELRKEIKNYDGSENDVLFSIFIEQIRVDYKNLLNDNCTVLDVIEWLSSKKMYQQTLTYLESKTPNEWRERGILNFTDINEIDEDRKNEFLVAEINAFIGCLYDVDAIRKEINKIKDGQSDYKTICDTDGLIKKNADFYKFLWARSISSDESHKLFVHYKNKKYKNIYVTTNVEDSDTSKLYMQLFMYKVLKEERNIWCHMLAKSHMEIDDLNDLIEMFIANGRELYK